MPVTKRTPIFVFDVIELFFNYHSGLEQFMMNMVLVGKAEVRQSHIWLFGCSKALSIIQKVTQNSQ
jgi:hypothetical protein